MPTPDRAEGSHEVEGGAVIREVNVTSRSRTFEVVIPTRYLVFVDANGTPEEVSIGSRVLWGDTWNRRGRYLGGKKPTEVKKVCHALDAALSRLNPKE